jgi:hypothetical protein
MQLDSLTLNTNLLSISTLLGTTSSQALIDDINARSGATSFFSTVDDPFKSNFQHFMNNVVQPFREVGRLAEATARKVFQRDIIRAIDSEKELKKGIPPCMQMPIIYHPRIRRMLEEERIDGFGINPKDLEPEDIYEATLENGYVDLCNVGEDGTFVVKHIETNEFPELSYEEAEKIRITREFIDQFIDDETLGVMDFTDYPSLHA